MKILTIVMLAIASFSFAYTNYSYSQPQTCNTNNIVESNISGVNMELCVDLTNASKPLTPEQISAVETNPITMIDTCTSKLHNKAFSSEEQLKLCDSSMVYLQNKCNQLSNIINYCPHMIGMDNASQASTSDEHIQVFPDEYIFNRRLDLQCDINHNIPYEICNNQPRTRISPPG